MQELSWQPSPLQVLPRALLGVLAPTSQSSWHFLLPQARNKDMAARVTRPSEACFAGSKPSDADFVCHQLCLPQPFVALIQGGVGKEGVEAGNVQGQVGTFWWKMLLPMGMKWPLRSLPAKPTWHSLLGGGQMLLEPAQFEPFHAAGGLPCASKHKRGAHREWLALWCSLVWGCCASCCHCLALPWI